MSYKLPDGKEIDLNEVRSVTPLREKDKSTNVMTDNRIGFTINLKNHERIEFSEIYHYSDWGPVRLKVKQTRDELISKLKEIDPSFSDS